MVWRCLLSTRPRVATRDRLDVAKGDFATFQSANSDAAVALTPQMRASKATRTASIRNGSLAECVRRVDHAERLRPSMATDQRGE